MIGSSKRVKGKEGVSEEAVYKKHTPSVPGKQQALGQNASLPGCGLSLPVMCVRVCMCVHTCVWP